MSVKQRLQNFVRLRNEGRDKEAADLLTSVFEPWLKEDQMRFQGIDIEVLLALAHYYTAVGHNLQGQAARILMEAEEKDGYSTYLQEVNAMLQNLSQHLTTVSFSVPGKED